MWKARDTALRVSYQDTRIDPNQAEWAVIHLEVKQHVQEPSRADLIEFERVNVGGTREWLKWCDRTGVSQFVFFSSIKAVRSVERVVTEDAAGPPESAYGVSKWRAEQLVREWASNSRQRCALILRPAVVYGPGSQQGNIYPFMEAIAQGRFCLAGRNDNLKSVISIANLCAAVNHLVTRLKPGVQIYNLADRETFSVRRLAELIAQCLGNSRRPRSLPLPLCRSAALFGDVFVRAAGRRFPITSARLESLLETSHFSVDRLLSTGFIHPQTTEEGLAEMVAWFQSRQKNGSNLEL
jgi:nucleoside-diphosphate-sugar epimerase